MIEQVIHEFQELGTFSVLILILVFLISYALVYVYALYKTPSWAR